MARNTHNAFSVRKHQRQGQPVWELLAADGQPVEESERFIHTLVLRGLSPRTRRAYAYDLLEAHRWTATRRTRRTRCHLTLYILNQRVMA